MPEELGLSYAVAMVLQSIALGHVYGYRVMVVILSRWEKQAKAEAAQRPPRKYYKVTRAGNAMLKAARERFPLLAKFAIAAEEEHV
jgi:PadR family transcriptional regulator PadR